MIDQKECIQNMAYLKDIFNLILTYRKSKNGLKNIHRIESNSFIKIPLLFNYIEKYNLYEKYPKYQKWIRHFEKFRAYSIVYEIIISSFIFIMIISLCIFMIWVLLQ